MNIAYILHSTETNGGATKAFLNMLDGVTQYGVKPFVVVPDKEGVWLELQKRQIPTLVVTYRPAAYPYFHTMQQRLLFFPRLLARIVDNRKATTVLTSFLKEDRTNSTIT